MHPVGTKSAASRPKSAAVSSCRRATVGSSPYTSSPTSASAIAFRISGVGFVTVSLRQSAARWVSSRPNGGSMHFAARMDRLGTETAFEVLAKAKKLEAEGKDIVHLEIGQPDFPTPAHVVDAGVKALRDGHTGYTPAP